jgi:ligand-binding sensor domain-containing protein
MKELSMLLKQEIRLPESRLRSIARSIRKSHSSVFVAGGLGLLLLSVRPCYAALDPTRALTQYTLEQWTTTRGLPNNTVDAIAQTADGYLWLGTEEGLVRFDGLRFIVFDKQNTPAIKSNHVSTLLTDKYGALWIGTQGGGLTRFRDGEFQTFAKRDGLTSDSILSL